MCICAGQNGGCLPAAGRPCGRVLSGISAAKSRTSRGQIQPVCVRATWRPDRGRRVRGDFSLKAARPGAGCLLSPEGGYHVPANLLVVFAACRTVWYNEIEGVAVRRQTQPAIALARQLAADTELSCCDSGCAPGLEWINNEQPIAFPRIFGR